MILLDAAGLAASRPGRPLYADVSVTLSSGDRVAVVGLNGCGKSTLLRQLAGRLDPEAGAVRRGRDARVVMLDQDAPLHGATVGEAIGDSWEAAAILDRLGIGGRLEESTSSLSGGEAKRVALARALVEVGPPGEAGDDVLLVLDEPTNHLDIDAIAWLEERLAQHRGGLLLVSHDRHVLDRVTTRILELDRGQGYVHDGGYAGYLEARAAREERAAKAEDVRRNLARSELAWLRRGAPARTSKPKSPHRGGHRVDRRPAPGASPPGRARPGLRRRRGSATPSSSSATSATGSAMAAGCSGASTWRSIPVSASASSGPTARVSRRCSTCWPVG